MWLSLILAFGAGCVMALQPAVNAKLATACSHPLQASIISFGTGFLALCVIGSFLKVGLPSASQLFELPTWAWIGGLLGTYMVTVSLLVAPQLGATRWLILVLAGQTVLAIILDHFGWLGFAQQSLTAPRAMGVVLFIIGAYMVLMR
jgi:bacterial/archaeal transporter family-2 protein